MPSRKKPEGKNIKNGFSEKEERNKMGGVETAHRTRGHCIDCGKDNDVALGKTEGVFYEIQK